MFPFNQLLFLIFRSNALKLVQNRVLSDGWKAIYKENEEFINKTFNLTQTVNKGWDIIGIFDSIRVINETGFKSVIIYLYIYIVYIFFYSYHVCIT